MFLGSEAIALKFGIWLPYSHAQWVAKLAHLAEKSGWDGVFLREQVVGLDRWIPIAAALLSTKRILIGGLISIAYDVDIDPIMEEALRIHRRSNQRLVVCVGTRIRDRIPAAHLSRSIAFSSQRTEPAGNGGPVKARSSQDLVVWRIGLWPDRASILQALSHQGIIPITRDDSGSLQSPDLDEFKELVDFIQRVDRAKKGFEIVVELALEDYEPKTLSDEAKRWEAAGATWWVLNYGRPVEGAQSIERLQEFISLGPPG